MKILSFIKDVVILFITLSLADLLKLSFWVELAVVFGILIVGEAVFTIIQSKREKTKK